MKKIVLLLTLVVFLADCKKSTKPELKNNYSIIGKWKLSDYYFPADERVDPNDIPWLPVDTVNDIYIQFNRDSAFVRRATGSIIRGGYYLSDSTLMLTNEGKTIHPGFRISEPPFISVWKFFI